MSRRTTHDTRTEVGEIVRAVIDGGGLSGTASSVLTTGVGVLKLLVPTSLLAAIRN